jgi:acetoin utilization deacetylase AcuC-like enzyme
MGFCLLANIAVAVEAALDAGLAGRVAVLDWDVHHGNGTEAIFYDRPEVLTISLHQERNFPLDRGAAEDTGSGAGVGANVNLPLPPGTGHAGYMEAFDRIVAPRISAFRPDVLMVACGYDAAALDPLGRMLLHSESFAGLTGRAMTLAEDLCGGRLVMVHEGGYSETYVPFCGHAALQRLARSPVAAEDPMLETWKARQPGPTFDRFLSGWIGELAEFHGV